MGGGAGAPPRGGWSGGLGSAVVDGPAFEDGGEDVEPVDRDEDAQPVAHDFGLAAERANGGAKLDHGTGGMVPSRRSKTLPVCRPSPVTGRAGGFTPGAMSQGPFGVPGRDERARGGAPFRGWPASEQSLEWRSLRLASPFGLHGCLFSPMRGPRLGPLTLHDQASCAVHDACADFEPGSGLRIAPILAKPDFPLCRCDRDTGAPWN